MFLKGKVALVTGAARNVGRGVALGLAREGAHVVLNDIDEAALAAVADAARSEGLSVSTAPGDISDAAAVERIVASTVAERGSLDVLVNNAIIHVNKGERGPFLAVAADGWREFMARNLDALFLATQRAAREMARRRCGSIINISSNGAVLAHRQRIAYDALKGAVEAFTRAVAVDLAPWKVRVNALRPCAIADPAEPASPAEERQKRLGEMIPMGRIARPADVAWACCYLASDRAEFVTGQVWNIDGGMLEQSRPPALELEPVVGPDDLEL